MSNSAKRISALSVTTILDANDRVVVLTNPDLTANDAGGRGYTDVQTIRILDIATELATTLLPAANDSSFGVIKIGAGLAIDEDGIVTAPLPVASNTVTGVVKIANNISFDSNGIISVSPTGPYIDDAAAATASVPLQGLYYDDSGFIKIRLT